MLGFKTVQYLFKNKQKNIWHNVRNVIYAYQCYFYNKQHVGEASSSSHVIANAHRLAIERKHLLSSLFTNLQVHSEDSSLSDYNRPALDDSILVPIELIHSTGSDWHDRINRLNDKPFGLIPWDHLNQQS